ncbi:AP2 domain-containing protein [uncultured Thomasclavelia sp.]|uniref:AP2 domain-containing protein n=1 Tax=uncultured Thomasclavelia sp. TaxID=3025759 RepID=UPI0025FE2DE6|nr:AP2 domain-containing protein [uncultured Thomasclavelia sp.]
MIKPKTDLTGKRFGRLTVIKQNGSHPKEGILWLCKCDCGNTVVVSTQNLNRGGVRSCGCLRKEMVSKRVKKEKTLKKYQIEDTNVSMLNSKLSKANKTGHKGVWYNKHLDKYEAYITFKKHRYHLGKYKNINDAILAREKAEKMLFDDFLKWYEENKKGLEH